jgi:hypothetical protein
MVSRRSGGIDCGTGVFVGDVRLMVGRGRWVRVWNRKAFALALGVGRCLYRISGWIRATHHGRGFSIDCVDHAAPGVHLDVDTQSSPARQTTPVSLTMLRRFHNHLPQLVVMHPMHRSSLVVRPARPGTGIAAQHRLPPLPAPRVGRVHGMLRDRSGRSRVKRSGLVPSLISRFEAAWVSCLERMKSRCRRWRCRARRAQPKTGALSSV